MPRRGGARARALLLLIMLGGTVPAWADALPLTPVQAAYLMAETRRAEDLFVQRVMRITGMPEAQVRRAVPGERITDTGTRVIAALEQARGQPLPEDQAAAIRAADEDRKQMLARAREAAATR